MGGAVGLDYNAVFLIADVLGVEMTPGNLMKLKVMEAEYLKAQTPKGGETIEQDSRNHNISEGPGNLKA